VIRSAVLRRVELFLMPCTSPVSFASAAFGSSCPVERSIACVDREWVALGRRGRRCEHKTLPIETLLVLESSVHAPRVRGLGDQRHRRVQPLDAACPVVSASRRLFPHLRVLASRIDNFAACRHTTLSTGYNLYMHVVQLRGLGLV
jgi:hypothetical protein